MGSSIPEMQLKLGLSQIKQVFMLCAILETNLAAVFVWLLSVGQKMFLIPAETSYCDLSGGRFIVRVGNNHRLKKFSALEALYGSTVS